jgi:hypothetical protein
MATYVNNLRLKEITTGDESGTWGTSTNTNLELVGEALGYGTEAITTNADTHASTVADGSADEARAIYIKYTGNLDSDCTITIGPNTLKRVHIIENATGDSGSSGPYNIIIKQGTGATVTIANGKVGIVYLDGAGSGAAVTDALTDLQITDSLLIKGPSITIGDATAEDTKLVFDGNAQDFYIGLDDSADDLVIGLGSAVGTTPAIEIDENQDIKFAQSIGVGQAASSTTGDIVAQTMALKGTTPTLTIGDAGAEDTKIVFDGNAKDFYIGLDDSADTLVIGDGSTLGTNTILTLTDDSVTIGDGAAVDTKIVYDGNAKDFYIGLDDSADKLVIGEGSTVGTNNIITVTDDTVTLGDAAAVDTALIFDGNAQDFHIALDDSADDLVVGVGSTVGSNTAFAVDENSKTTFSGASQFNSTVTVGVDDTGYDVKLFGATASKYMLWDESADSLIVKDIVDAVNYKVNGGQGSDGQVLTSTGSGVAWEDAASGGITGLTGLVENSSIWLGADPNATTDTAQYNVGLGVLALDAITTGDYNTAIGWTSGSKITTGSYNTVVGQSSGDALTTQSQNTYIGSSCGYVATGAENVALGYASFLNGTSSDSNVCLGWFAGSQLTTGDRNIAIGPACNTSSSGTTENSIAIGLNSFDGIGTNYFSFGKGTGDDRVYNKFDTNASWTRVSDQRFKKDIQDNTDCGLDFINDLRPVTFKFKAKSELDSSMPTYDPDDDTPNNGGNKMYGLIAQEVKAALDKHNITDFGGWDIQDVDQRELRYIEGGKIPEGKSVGDLKRPAKQITGADGMQGISQEMFIHPLIKAVQELSAKLTAAEARITTLEG